jgi:hypothetical protein
MSGVGFASFFRSPPDFLTMARIGLFGHRSRPLRIGLRSSMSIMCERRAVLAKNSVFSDGWSVGPLALRCD